MKRTRFVLMVLLAAALGLGLVLHPGAPGLASRPPDGVVLKAGGVRPGMRA